MNKHDKRKKRILYVLILIYGVTSIYGFYHNYQVQDMNALAMGGLALLTPLIVPITFTLLKLKPVYEIYIINIVFVYFASLIGSSFHGYSLLGFDKALHFASGLMFATVSIIVFMTIKKVRHVTNKEDYYLFLIFINAFNLSIAVFWEFFEYAMLIFFNNDCINHYSQGVHDAMTDMLCAFVGGILITGMLMHAYKKNKGNFVINVCEKFYILNIEPHLK